MAYRFQKSEQTKGSTGDRVPTCTISILEGRDQGHKAQASRAREQPRGGSASRHGGGPLAPPQNLFVRLYVLAAPRASRGKHQRSTASSRAGVRPQAPALPSFASSWHSSSPVSATAHSSGSAGSATTDAVPPSPASRIASCAAQSSSTLACVGSSTARQGDVSSGRSSLAVAHRCAQRSLQWSARAAHAGAVQENSVGRLNKHGQLEADSVGGIEARLRKEEPLHARALEREMPRVGRGGVRTRGAVRCYLWQRLARLVDYASDRVEELDDDHLCESNLRRAQIQPELPRPCWCPRHSHRLGTQTEGVGWAHRQRESVGLVLSAILSLRYVPPSPWDRPSPAATSWNS